MPQGSVSLWIQSLNSGELDAAQKLWDRYAGSLVELVRAKLRDVPKGHADEEDIAQNVFASLCRGAAAGRLLDVTNRDELWWLLLAVTRQKVASHVRRETTQKRGTGRVRTESAIAADAGGTPDFSLDNLVGSGPSPEFVAILNEQHRHLLSLLQGANLPQVANMRIEGYTVAEIAEKLGISLRAVERKLQIIRSKWADELLRIE
jgi:DNA-directed RNA polymerase specialized sigma24 family protein